MVPKEAPGITATPCRVQQVGCVSRAIHAGGRDLDHREHARLRAVDPERGCALKPVARRAARAANRARIPAATGEPARTAASVMSAMKGWLPKSMVSDSGNSASVKARGPTHQPLRKPGAAWDLEIEDAATARSSSPGGPAAR